MLDKKDLISVILPVYNAEKYLKEAILSILNQSYSNFELIILNDGSKDSSMAIINKFKLIDSRIRVIDRENKGLVYTLNEGLVIANGEFIARMDADDICLPNRFESQIMLMKDNKLDICGCHYFLINEEGSIDGLNLVPISHELCILSLSSKVPFAHPSVMIKKDFLYKKNIQYGQSQYKIAEDFDLWLRMFKEGAVFGNVNDVLFKYRVIAQSLSKINNVDIKKETKLMLNEFTNNNKTELMRIIHNLPKNLNAEENELVVRTVFNIFIKTFNFKVLKYLKKISKKTIVCTILSELVKNK